MTTPTSDFRLRLASFARTNASWLVVGLDPEPSKLPPGFSPDAAGILAFNRELIAATKDFVMGYKLNFAFYESLGQDAWITLSATRDAIPTSLMAIADAKRGDIAETSRLYAASIFDQLGFDAVTLSPYVGREGLAPFLSYRDRGSFVVCRTSNRESSFQTAVAGDTPLYESVARKASIWGSNVGLVVGATDLPAIRTVRSIAPNTPLLVPGVGAQGGTLEEAFHAAADCNGENALFPLSRSIIYASSDGDFAGAAGRRAHALQQEMAALARVRTDRQPS
jgi:orotidine-5'-phosphate decarboxylase